MLWERWDSDEIPIVRPELACRGRDIIITITGCLFESGLSPRLQTTDHHLRQELFVVIFTASCQQELNLS